MEKIRSIRQVTRNPRLNFFEAEAADREGKLFPYYIASRARTERELYMFDRQKRPDGVVIYSVYGEARDRLVLLRQYRYPMDAYVYEFPAGLVEEGEDFRAAAVREMKEETGLDLAVAKVPAAFERPFGTTVGMTDERCSMVFGTASGQISLKGLESSEDLQVILADRREARRILEEENVAVMCAYMLMHFISDKGDPLAFAEGTD